MVIRHRHLVKLFQKGLRIRLKKILKDLGSKEGDDSPKGGATEENQENSSRAIKTRSVGSLEKTNETNSRL